MRNRCCRSKNDTEQNNYFPTLSVFETKGTAIGKERSRYVTDAEYVASDLNVLLNCDEIRHYTVRVPP